MGFLLRDGSIVGRFIWGTSTCDCEKIEFVESSYTPYLFPGQTIQSTVFQTRQVISLSG